MCICLIESIRGKVSSPYFLSACVFVIDFRNGFSSYQHKRYALSNAKFNLVIFIKGSLNLSKLLILIKQENMSPRTFILVTYGILQMVFSAKLKCSSVERY